MSLHPTLRILLVATASLLVGCASTAPIVYQRPNIDAATTARIARDTDACRRQAVEMVGLNDRRAASRARDAAAVGAIGFVGAAVGTAVAKSREVWQKARGAAAAGISGMATKLVVDWNQPDEVHQEYVSHCLKERGHVVLGWR
jgi:type IV pilus biogenesis protein CpaD/CtpE